MKYVSIYIEVFMELTIMEIPDEMLKEIRESGYDQELVYNYIRELLVLDCDKKFCENGKNLMLMDNYCLDKRFMRELEDSDEYDAA